MAIISNRRQSTTTCHGDWTPPPPEPPPPTPEELLAQAQMADIQARTSIDQQKLALDSQKLELDAVKQQQLDDRETARISGDLALREFNLEETFQSKVDLEILKKSLEDE